MRTLVLSLALIGSAGCRSGLLETGEWGTFRYFGELVGAATCVHRHCRLMRPGALDNARQVRQHLHLTPEQ